METMKKLPIGIQTFNEIRTENYIYIDKTKIAFDLIENGSERSRDLKNIMFHNFKEYF